MKKILIFLVACLPLSASAQIVKGMSIMAFDSIPNVAPFLPNGTEIAYSQKLRKMYSWDLVLGMWKELNPSAAPVAQSTKIYCPAHGLDTASYTASVIAIRAGCNLANAIAGDSLQTRYVVGIPDVDTLEIQVSGLVYRPAHGLTSGTVYYLQDTPSGESGASAGTVASKTFVVVDENYIHLIDPAATGSGNTYIPFVNIPAAAFSVYGTDPKAPIDTSMQNIAEAYAAAGAIVPGSQLIAHNSSISDNETYRAYPDGSSTPFHAWTWNGEKVTRQTSRPVSIDLQDTLYGGSGTLVLTPLVPAGSVPTTAEVVTWLETNYDNNALRLPNGSIAYWVGTGSTSEPEAMWQIQDDLSASGGTNFSRIVKKLAGGGTIDDTDVLVTYVPNFYTKGAGDYLTDHLFGIDFELNKAIKSNGTLYTNTDLSRSKSDAAWWWDFNNALNTGDVGFRFREEGTLRWVMGLDGGGNGLWWGSSDAPSSSNIWLSLGRAGNDASASTTKINAYKAIQYHSVTPTASEDLVNKGYVDALFAGGTVDSTRIIQDSIAVYYQGGIEIGRDTIRTPGSGGGSGEPSDGDKGDITVSGSGLTWNIDAGVVGPDELASTAVTPGSYTYSSITVDADGRITAASNGTTPGDVTGPGSSTDNAIARYDGTTGKVVQNSTITISDAGAMTMNGGNIILNGEWLSGDGGDEGIFVNSSGQIGIGTSSIITALDVEFNDNSFNAGIHVRNTNTGTNALSGFKIENSSGQPVGQMLYVPSNYTTPSLQSTLLFSSLRDTKIGFVANVSSGTVPQDIYFKRNGPNVTNDLFIQGSDGSVGIQENTPQHALDVTGDISATGKLISDSGDISLDGSDLVRIDRGTGSPESVVTASPGSLYFDTSGGAHWRKGSGTGSTGYIRQVGKVSGSTNQLAKYDANGDIQFSSVTDDGTTVAFGTRITTAAGSAAAPVVAATSDDDTGLYFGAANQVNVSAGNNNVASFGNALIYLGPDGGAFTDYVSIEDAGMTMNFTGTNTLAYHAINAFGDGSLQSVAENTSNNTRTTFWVDDDVSATQQGVRVHWEESATSGDDINLYFGEHYGKKGLWMTGGNSGADISTHYAHMSYNVQDSSFALFDSTLIFSKDAVPVTTSGAKTELEWTGDGTNAAPTVVRTAYGTATITGDADGENSVAVTISPAMPDATYTVFLTVEQETGTFTAAELQAYVRTGKGVGGFTIEVADAIDNGEEIFIHWIAKDN